MMPAWDRCRSQVEGASERQDEEELRAELEKFMVFRMLRMSESRSDIISLTSSLNWHHSVIKVATVRFLPIHNIFCQSTTSPRLLPASSADSPLNERLLREDRHRVPGGAQHLYVILCPYCLTVSQEEVETQATCCYECTPIAPTWDGDRTSSKECTPMVPVMSAYTTTEQNHSTTEANTMKEMTNAMEVQSRIFLLQMLFGPIHI
uniref:Uncharacterized protein n=1 Tax=Steinernema glaseri TaxID=37863 RepID=A0A1I7ZY43_9BILA